ncbi:hypothetical protein D3C85_1626930 [compost metagenome]
MVLYVLFDARLEVQITSVSASPVVMVLMSGGIGLIPFKVMFGCLGFKLIVVWVRELINVRYRMSY